jgi:hypothetical protein
MGGVAILTLPCIDRRHLLLPTHSIDKIEPFVAEQLVTMITSDTIAILDRHVLAFGVCFSPRGAKPRQWIGVDGLPLADKP